ncbi:hypothetical protein TRFO_14390 [Tritrichomonas foetus]|uniref:USP domain-containing protein n=1 Tax=Tritrichomonas foetus TaxID=1144522 RepID=A0A1J4L017_9EUKA|nr:hypothetical protein TRFO_14390 [Tritrichomonas foetus]|eukprot:OHT15197.1 hypothetical protein TRFO_14390 [Tritrichomonas foetus]
MHKSNLDPEKVRAYKKELRQLRSEFEPKATKKGQICYLVNSQWYEKLIRFVDQSSSEWPYEMPDVKDHTKATYLSPEIWLILRKIFGGPVLPKRGCFILHPQTNKPYFFLEHTYKNFTISFKKEENSKPVSIRKLWPLNWQARTLKEYILETLNIKGKQYHFFCKSIDKESEEPISESLDMSEVLEIFPGILTLKPGQDEAISSKVTGINIDGYSKVSGISHPSSNQQLLKSRRDSFLSNMFFPQSFQDVNMSAKETVKRHPKEAAPSTREIKSIDEIQKESIDEIQKESIDEILNSSLSDHEEDFGDSQAESEKSISSGVQMNNTTEEASDEYSSSTSKSNSSSTSNSNSISSSNSTSTVIMTALESSCSNSDIPLYSISDQGNFCYINSSIQCLIRVFPITNFIRKFNFPNNGNLICSNAYLELINVILDGSKPDQIRAKTAQLNRIVDENFASGEQQDAHEFLTKLVDKILEEYKNINVDEKNEKFSSFKNEYNKMLNSIITKTETQIHCSKCKMEAVAKEEIHIILILPNFSKTVTVNNLIKNFCKSSNIVDYACEYCKKKRGIINEVRITQLPEYFTLLINRFEDKDNKNKNSVSLQKQITVTDCNKKEHIYQLVGMINHEGDNIRYGHYFSIVYLSQSNQYYQLNDGSIRIEDDFESKSMDEAYILFYHLVT